MVQVVLTLLIALALVVPTGRYLYRVLGGDPTPGDRLFQWLERPLYRLIGLKQPDQPMDWKQYALAFLLSNGLMMLLCYLVISLQSMLPLNPQGAPGMRGTLAFNTAISFMTNTNLQHYTGEVSLSYLSQMVAITFLMFTAAASGLSMAVAFMRGLAGRPLGNFWQDMTRVIVRILLPAAFIVALLLVWQGTPQTLKPSLVVTTLEGAKQQISVGPVAALESIKHLGTNGGGFFGANSAHPFENPTPLTNLLEILCMLWLPTSLIYTFGLFIKDRRQGWVLFAAAGAIFLVLLGSMLYFEHLGNPLLPGAVAIEGKEVRFGIDQSVLFSTVTTAATTGSVNNMHDSLTPMGSFTPLVLMALNSIFGGKGVGFMNLTAMAMIGIFLIGLMVGRTPEFLGKRIEPREITLLAVVILIHPIITLAPTALALVTEAGRAGISHPSFHGFTQALYEMTSAAANNGSAFEGLHDNTPWWNGVTGIVMLLGRYPSMIILLALAGTLAGKRAVPAGPSTLRTNTPLFTGVLIGAILIVGALTFFPALALGPVAEHLTLFK